MTRHDRRRARLAGVEALEGRALLSTLFNSPGRRSAGVAVGPPVIPGNAGQIRVSQFQLDGDFTHLGSPRWGLALGGPLVLRRVTPNRPDSPSRPAPRAPVNIGLIAGSQFDAGGFQGVGTQLMRVHAGRGLTIDVYDESPSGGGAPAGVPGVPINSGAVISTQFNDNKFGDVGVQWRGVRTGGGITILERALHRNPDGTLATGQGGSTPPPDIKFSANANLLGGSQFNDGGFGKLGLQWHDVHVHGPVALSSESYIVQPLPPGPPPAPVIPPDRLPAQFGGPTNTGIIQATQFNDGGFGDVGEQWWNVKVGGRVAASTSQLSIQPELNSVGPITISGLTFGKRQIGPALAPTSGAAVPGVAVGEAVAPGVAVTPAPPAVENEATNSGRLVNTQFSDGGFGDVGMQWRDVKVKGSVSTVHNSLSVQPENAGQGLITVQGIRFPSAPAPSPSRTGGAGVQRAYPPSPPLIGNDGFPRTGNRTSPTQPFANTSLKNEATNSGDILDSQFSDGGFGDVGMQWSHTRVGRDVGVVHNSLSVRPEGSLLGGVNVSDIAFGDPVVPQPRPRARMRPGLSLAVLPELIINPPPGGDGSGGQDGSNGQQPNTQESRGDVNHVLRDHQQYSNSVDADVVLQWDTVHRNGGLVIVHNVITIQAGGPSTAPITLRNIRFPGTIPPINASPNRRTGSEAAAVPLALRTPSSAGLLAVPTAAPTGTLPVNAATNSGLLVASQFSDGGFGDIGMQWRNVKIHDDVTVVHNSLSVEVPGSDTGPVTIANITFNSGAIDGRQARPGDLQIISPPKFVSQLPRFRPTNGRFLRQDPAVLNAATNSGALLGGQFANGGFGHIGLQWRNVGIPGKVTIIDNVLSIKTSGARTSPITIENVTFA